LRLNFNANLGSNNKKNREMLVALFVHMNHANTKYLGYWKKKLLENSLYTTFEKMRVNAKVFFLFLFVCSSFSTSFKRQASVGKIA